MKITSNLTNPYFISFGRVYSVHFECNICYTIPIKETYYEFVIYKCMSTTFCDNGTVHFTLFLVAILNIIIATICAWLNVVLGTYFFNIENWLTKHVSNFSQIKLGFVKFDVIFLLFKMWLNGSFNNKCTFEFF